MWYDVIVDALLDTAKLLPFFLLLYILIELMEHKTAVGKPSRLLAGRAAPFIGAATGLVPLCGFSVMAAKLYEHRHVTLGALFAVFISTSDEALLVLLLSNAEGFTWANKGVAIALLLGAKLLLGVAVGYAIDLIFRKKTALAPMPAPEHLHGHADEHDCADGHIHEHADEHEEGQSCAEEHIHAEEDDEEHERGDCHCAELTVCEHRKSDALRVYLLSPLLHALEVAAFVLVVNLAFGFLFWGLGKGDFGAGQALVSTFMQGAGYWFQPLVCPLIGLIPNCASSVVLAETYALGGIAFGGLLGGLVTNAGLGYVVLFRRKRDVKGALIIIAAMLLIGVAVGYIANAIALAI